MITGVYNICCIYFNRYNYTCDSPERPKMLGIFKRACMCVPNLFVKCPYQVEYPDAVPPKPFIGGANANR